MKKTIFTTSLIIWLLCSGLAKAQTTDFLIPATAYTLSSTAGTFTDIADKAGTFKFGNDLEDGTVLKNGFFVNNETTPFVTHVGDKKKTDPGFELGFDFNFCGKTMTHFTICASGGIFFGADANIPQGQSQSWHAFYGWDTIDLQNVISVITKDAANNLNTAQSISGKSPVMYLIEGDAGAKILTVQYDYAINGDEWIYQLKIYEESGNIELVVNSLATANAGGNAYRLFLGLVENGNYSISDDPFDSKHLNLQDKHFLGITQSTASAWSTVTPFTGTSTAPDGLFVKADNAPEAGRTLTFKAPATCAEKAQKFKDEWYGFSATGITKTSFSGKITFDKSRITPAEMTAAGTFVAILSTSETPDYTLANGTWYQADSLLNGNKVLANAKPRYSINADGWNGNIYDITFSANGLIGATTYYIHIYAMDYRCMGAPVYSDLCRTFPVTTSLDLPQTLSAGLPTTSSVPLTLKPAENLGMVVFKSPNTNALNLSGKLKAGDKIGEAEVLTVITTAGQSVYNAPFEAGEGAYILAYSILNPETETPVYGQDFLTLPVRAAYDTLPKFRFDNETYTYPQANAFGRLPFGWNRETEFPADQRNRAFKLEMMEPMSAPSYICLNSSYPNGATYWSDVVTAAFALPSGIDKISATFFLIFNENSDGGFEPTTHNMTANDRVRIEYSVNGGAWQTALEMDGLNDNFPQLNAQKQYPLNALIRELTPGDIIRLRFSYRATKTNSIVYCQIPAVDVAAGKDCLTPKALQSVDSLTTNERLTVRWMDDNLVSNFLLAYQTEEGAWQYKRISATNRDIDEPVEGEIAGLKAGTVYDIKVAAICSSRDTSFYTEPLTARTAFSLPYAESLAKTGSGATAQTPFDRGVKTYSGVIGRQLTETTEAQTEWNQLKTSAPDNAAIAVSVSDFTTNAWLMLPALYIRSIGGLMPKSLNFTLNSFDTDKNKGAKPNYNDTKLKVLVSGNGLFTQDDIIQTLDADDLALNDQTFTVDLTDREGFLQVAFVFECPTGAQNASKDDDNLPNPWYLEIKDVLVRFDVEICFPVENLERSLGIHEVPLTWNASASAVEYGIFWGVYSEEGYRDSAFTTEAHYTITGLQDQTRYKAMVIAYCNEDHSLAALPAMTSFRTLTGCHTPENFHVADIFATGADFVSTSDQPDYMTQRIVYITPDKGGKTFALIQDADTLHVRDSLTKLTAYTATTQAVCEADTSEMSEAILFTTLDKPNDSNAVETHAQLNGLFNVRAQDGQIAIRNLNNLLVRNVTVFNLSAAKLADFRVDSRDDLLLPIGLRRMLIFVRLQTERGMAVYKIYLP